MLRLHYIVLIFLLIFPIVSGINVVYPVNLNDELCQAISFETNNLDIDFSDVWTNNISERDLDFYNNSASDFGLSVTYSKNLTESEEEIVVCILASQLGNYYGKISSNTKEVLVDVLVEEIQEEVPQNTGGSGGGGGSSGGGGGGGGSSGKLNVAVSVVNKNETNANEAKKTEFEELSFDESSTESTEENLNLEETQENSKFLIREKNKFLSLVPIVFIVFVLVAKIYVERKRISTKENNVDGKKK